MDAVVDRLLEYNERKVEKGNYGLNHRFVDGPAPPAMPNRSTHPCRSCGACCFSAKPITGATLATPRELLEVDDFSRNVVAMVRQRVGWFRVYKTASDEAASVDIFNACGALTENYQCSLVANSDSDAVKQDGRPQICKDYEPSYGLPDRTPCLAEQAVLLLEVRDGRVLRDFRRAGDNELILKKIQAYV